MMMYLLSFADDFVSETGFAFWQIAVSANRDTA
jgi:hypothetical protein